VFSASRNCSIVYGGGLTDLDGVPRIGLTHPRPCSPSHEGGSLFVDVHSVIEGSLLGILELIGIGSAVALYASDRRAHTDADHYHYWLYSPRNKPRIKTPKWVFIPFPLLITTSLVTIEVLAIWHGRLSPVATFVCHAVLWLVGAGCFAWVILLLVTTRPDNEPPRDTLSERPIN
jgi:hypothetical protein